MASLPRRRRVPFLECRRQTALLRHRRKTDGRRDSECRNFRIRGSDGLTNSCKRIRIPRFRRARRTFSRAKGSQRRPVTSSGSYPQLDRDLEAVALSPASKLPHSPPHFHRKRLYVRFAFLVARRCCWYSKNEIVLVNELITSISDFHAGSGFMT